MRWPRLRVLPAFYAIAGLALVVKLGGAIAAIGNVGLAAAEAAQPAPAPAAQPAPSDAAKSDRPAAPAPVDADTLKALAQRRAELDKRAEEIRDKEATIAAAQKRLDEKLAEARAIEGKIAAAEKARDEAEEARIMSLVKIYEKMKPKDAAQVFERLEMPVLLKVIERMKEAKSAPILAAMDPAKAKAVTVAIAGKDDPKAPPAKQGKL
jgi:flagellar motility protein MotE (MotC chaperone)